MGDSVMINPRLSQVTKRDFNIHEEDYNESTRYRSTGSGKAFLRSSPKPIDIVKTSNLRLLNNQNAYETFVTKHDEKYKVKVFENFKAMNSQMNKAFLRQIENRKFFKGNNAVPEEYIKLKEEDDQTLDKISAIFKYVHKHQRATSYSGNASSAQTNQSLPL